jgi:transposase
LRDKPTKNADSFFGSAGGFRNPQKRELTEDRTTGLGAILVTKAQVEVINSVRRRRRWSRAEKERIVAAAMEPGAVASAVARGAGIQASQLVRWRQQLQGAPPLGSITVQIPSDVSPIATLPMPSGVIEVELASGVRIRISGAVDAPVVSAVMKALADCGRR